MVLKNEDRITALRENGLPVFCSSRHYVAHLNVCSVPMWELPRDGSWISCGREPNHHNFDTLQEVEGEHYAFRETDFDSGSETDEEHSQHDMSELPLEDLEDGRTWCLALVDRAPTLFRLMPALCDTTAKVYGVGVSSSFFPYKLRQTSDAVLDEHLLQGLSSPPVQSAVLALNSSGHFAGAIFRGPDAIVHKTLHRYTSRAKQGGSQAAFDASGKKAKSAGSNLRRHCQQRLREEICELLTQQWASELAACDKIFIAVSNRMRSTLIGTREHPFVPFEKISSLPFAVPKPTFDAVSEAYRRVARVIFCDEQTMEKLVAKTVPSTRAKVDVREVSDPLSNSLHIASANGDEDKIFEFLDAGVDPTAQDSKGRVPFDVCLSRGARRAFRVWREQNEGAWDWSAARVPGDNAERQEESLRCTKNKSKGKKGKTEQNRVVQNELVLSSPKGSAYCSADEIAHSPAKRRPRNSIKGRPSATNTSRSQMPQKGLASAKSKAHSEFVPRRPPRLSLAHRLTN